MEAIAGVTGSPGQIVVPQSAVSSVSRLKTKEEREKETKTARMATGVSIVSAFGLGYVLRNGLNEGFKSIGSFGRFISSIFAIPATFLIPITTAYSEYEQYRAKNSTEQSSSRLIQTVYPILSIAFAPMTAFVPLEKATQSKGHLLTTLINLPHIGFTFFSYTGGRFLTLLKSLKLAFFKLSDEEKFRLENERKIVQSLGDIGSDNAAVTPEAHQFMSGWMNIIDLFRGNFSGIKERFNDAPVTNILGTFIGSIFWIPTYIGKSMDTIARTLEMSDQLQSTMSENSLIYRFAKRGMKLWHDTAAGTGFLGNTLTKGREFGKIMQAIASPLGMISVVFPVFDHFRHGFKNEEADEVGGSVKFYDKILNVGAFLGHCYFTVLYGLFVRLPQTAITSTYYICNGINWTRGVLDKPNDPNYIDPRKIRDKLFNPIKGWVKSISDFAGDIIEKNTGKKFLYDGIYKVIAEEECYRPIREAIVKRIFQSDHYETINDQTGEKGVKQKQPYKELPLEEWGKILKDFRQDILKDGEARLRKYLEEASRFDQEKVNDFFGKHKIYDKIKAELENLIDGEINACKADEEPPKLKSNNFFEMLLHPVKYWDDVKEVFKLKTAIAQLIISPLNVLDFVNMIEMGDKDQPYWLTNWLLQESSIRIGDYKAGNYGELMTVYCHAVQTCGKGIAHFAKGFGRVLGKAA